MDLYFQTLLLDVPTVTVCAFLLARYGDLRFSHPATPYLVFHVHTVTSRLLGLAAGGTTLFSYPHWRGNYLPVQPEEIQRAALYADLALIAMTAVWLCAGIAARRRPVAYTPASAPQIGMLNPRLLWTVIVVSFLIGLVGLFIGAQVPGLGVNERLASFGEWGSSSYLLIIQMWSGLALLAYFYLRGFHPLAVAMFTCFLVIMAYQGYHRFRVIIPLLLAIHIWLEQHRRRWPSARMVLGLSVIAFAFFPMKTVGVMLREGHGLSTISEEVSSAMSEVVGGSAPDQTFLDQLASALTLLDMRGEMYFGRMYLSIFTLPIPRQWWPDKPGLATFLTEVSIPERPMKQNGMIATFIGESYANLGLLGVILIPALGAALLILFQNRANRGGYGSTVAFAYALVSVNLIQVYRDGLVSLVTFTLVNMMPLTVIVLMQIGHSWVTRHEPLTQLRPGGSR